MCEDGERIDRYYLCNPSTWLNAEALRGVDATLINRISRYRYLQAKLDKDSEDCN